MGKKILGSSSAKNGIYIPSGLTTVLDVVFLKCLPPTIHFISAGGFDGAVVQVNETTSPTLASDNPEIDT